MVKKTLIIFSSLLICLSVFSFSSLKKKTVPKQKILRTVIIDAGHGIMANGGHNGAKGAYSYEDEICLAVSKELVKKFATELPDIKVIESRPTDKITAIHRRAEIANENNGDLFICIHVNAAVGKKHTEISGYKTITYYEGKGKNRKKKTKRVPTYRTWTVANAAKGAETYICGAHKNEDKELAVRENAPMLQEDNFKKNYGDINPNSPEFVALSLLKTKQYFKRSANLAGFVQDEFAKVGRIDRDVRQRQVGIWVLQATAMPSILVETGYITNREEEDYLNSKKGQIETVDCIIKAVKTYIAWLEKQQQNSVNTNDNVSVPVSGSINNFLESIEQIEKQNSSR